VVLLLAERLEHVASVLLHQFERDRAVVVLQHGSVVVQHRQVIACSRSNRYDTIERCYFNVRSKADMRQLNLPHGNNN